MNRRSFLKLGVAGAASMGILAREALAGKPYKMTINAAGASFPFPVYSDWAYKYEKLTGMRLNYQPIGSGGGQAQIKAKTVDFAGSDAPMKPADLDEHGLVQFPMLMGGIVPIINLPGLKAGQLKLSREALSGIFLGKIKKWNDGAIKKENSGVNLPDRDIQVVHRTDGSGTTFIFTTYLSKMSSEWKDKVGAGKAVDWPCGLGGKQNQGVAVTVSKVPGAVGYVEFAYASENNLAYAQMQNQDGKYIMPTIETFQAAAANADWGNAPGFYLDLTDQPGAESWPITGVTFILMHKNQLSKPKAQAILTFLDWCYRHGGELAVAKHYVPMPLSVVQLVQTMWCKDLKSNGQPVWPV